MTSRSRACDPETVQSCHERWNRDSVRTSLCLPSSKSQRAGYAALPGTSQLDNDKMLACIHATQQHALRLIFTINGPATRTSVLCMVSDASTKECQLCRHVRYLVQTEVPHCPICSSRPLPICKDPVERSLTSCQPAWPLQGLPVLIMMSSASMMLRA